MFTLDDFRTQEVQNNSIKEPPTIEPGAFNHEEIFLKAKEAFSNKMERTFKKVFLDRLTAMNINDFQVRKALEHVKENHPLLLEDTAEARKEIQEVFVYYMKLVDKTFKFMHLIMDIYKTEVIDMNQMKLEAINRDIQDNKQVEECQYKYITKPEELEEALRPFFEREVLGVDIETTGLDPHTDEIRLVQVAGEGLPVLMIDMFKLSRESMKPVEELLKGPVLKIFQNGKFDLKFLTKNNFKVSRPYFDTMLASQIISAGEKNYKGKHSLAGIVKKYLRKELSKEQQRSDWSRKELSPGQLLYAARDAYILLKLYDVLSHKLLKESLQEAAGLEFDILPAVVEMELTGIYLDTEKMKKLSLKIEEDLKKAEERLEAELAPALEKDMFGNIDVNLNSPAQLLLALRGLGLKVRDTSEETLKKHYKEPVIKAVLEYRKLSKAFNTYSLKCYKPHINSATGRIHPSYYQITSAGRFSCSNPNLQQVPRDVKYRECFRAEEGNLIICSDYSQIELRTAAEVANDETMIKAYQEGQDLHKLTASLVTGKKIDEITKEERQKAKASNFGLIYGQSAKGLAVYAKNSYGVDMSEKEAEQFRNKFFKAYKGLKKWHMKTKTEKAYEVRTLSGRRRKWSKKDEFYLTTRLNAPIQGTAADILKKAFTLLPEALEGTGAKIVGTVHDEILLECQAARAEEVAKILKATMEDAGKHYLVKVPVISEPETGKTWADAK